MPSGVPVEYGLSPRDSPAGGFKMLRRKVPSAPYSLITPLNTLETYSPPSGAGARPAGVARSFAPEAMNTDLFTLDAIGAPVASVESQPPAASGPVGKGPVNLNTPPRAVAT